MKSVNKTFSNFYKAHNLLVINKLLLTVSQKTFVKIMFIKNYEKAL